MIYRNESLIKACREQICFLRLPGCTGQPTAAAHSNLLRHGRGHAHKSHDCFVVPACLNCGREFDHGKLLIKEQRELIWMGAWERWMLYAWQEGIFKVEN